MVAVSVVLVGPSPSRAASPVPALQIAGCAPEIAGALPSLVSLEIDVLLRERGATRSAPDTIAVRCAEDAAYIEVAVAGTRREARLALEALAADHRARAIALAVAELVDAMSRPVPAPAQDPAPPATAAAAAPRPEVQTASDNPEGPFRGRGRLALLLGPVAEWLGEPKQMLLGGRVAVHYRRPTIAPSLSMDASFGDFASTSGQITARTLGGAAHLYFGTGVGKLHASAGPGVRLGWVHLRGEPPNGSTLAGRSLSALWGGPELRARIAYEVFPPLLAALELGAGLVVQPVRGLVDGATRVYSIDGIWSSACLQIGTTW